MIHLSIKRRVLSRNQLDKMHWSGRVKERAMWVTLIRSQLAYAFECAGNFANVVIVSYRNRILDDDNLCGGCKGLRDALKHTKLIADDNRKSASFTYEQIQVPKKEERTEIMVSYPKGAGKTTACAECNSGKSDHPLAQ